MIAAPLTDRQARALALAAKYGGASNGAAHGSTWRALEARCLVSQHPKAKTWHPTRRGLAALCGWVHDVTR